MYHVKTFDGSRDAGQETSPVPPLKKGTIFLILEERPSMAYMVLRRSMGPKDHDGPSITEEDSTKNGLFKGLIITRQFPPDLAKDQDLSDIPTFWLTTNLRQDQKTISPSAIPRLNLIMGDFLQDASEGLAVVDCLEYLITQNSFEVILRLIQAWNDKIVGTRKRILLSVDPLTLTIQQLHLIKKECLDLNPQFNG